MLHNFVVDIIGGPLPVAYAFIPYVLSGLLLFVFSAIILNFVFGAISQFIFKS